MLGRLVFEETFSVPDDLQVLPPLTCVLEIVNALNLLFMESPKLLRLPGDTALTLLYRDVAIFLLSAKGSRFSFGRQKKQKGI